MDLEREILSVIKETAADSGKTLVHEFGNDTVLLESGLDSLDFAIVVARLEDKLNADPFSASAEPLYPRTLADFIQIYEAHFADAK